MVRGHGGFHGLARAFHSVSAMTLQPLGRPDTHRRKCGHGNRDRPRLSAAKLIHAVALPQAPRAPLRSPVKWSDIPNMEWPNARAAGSAIALETAEQRFACCRAALKLSPRVVRVASRARIDGASPM